MTDVQKIQLQRWWMNEVRAITRKVMRAEENRKAKEQIKSEALLGDYASREEIVEAYGYGMITEKHMNKLLDIWDKANKGSGEMYEAKICLLQDVYQEAQQVMRDLGQEE